MWNEIPISVEALYKMLHNINNLESLCGRKVVVHDRDFH